MIKDRTVEYLKLKPSEGQNDLAISSSLTISTLKNAQRGISNLKTNISQLQKQQNKHSLPSFTDRTQTKSNINNLKMEINLNFKIVEVIVRNLRAFLMKDEENCFCGLLQINTECDDTCKEFYTLGEEVIRFILLYYAKEYKDSLFSYRKLEKAHLEKTKNFAVFDELETKNYKRKAQSHQLKEQETAKKDKLEQINLNIYNLTTTLIELKNILYLQDLEIDSVYIQIEKLNKNMKRTNKEIEKFGKKFKGIKDKTIISLFIVILALMFCVLLRIHSKY